MKHEEAAILLSCHTFEDFPVFHRGEGAESLLANWTALWHPQLIDHCGRMPTWYRLEEPPTSDVPRILVQPTTEGDASQPSLSEAVTAAGGVLIEREISRQTILNRILEAIGGARPVDQDLAADFMALGFAYLQTELLTRQMRYSTRMPETNFATNLVAAANQAMSGETNAARDLLQSCYDLLSQERNHYYAVDIYLLDLAMVAQPLIGAPLQHELEHPTKINLLLPAELLEPIEQSQPNTWARLRDAVENHRLGLVGGEWSELPLSQLASDTIRRQLELGLSAFQERLGQRPRVYGRRQFGLVPALPQILLRLDYHGALHATFDGGRFPQATQAKSRWEGDGQFSIDAITRPPLDATLPETFLNLATSLSETMDMDHIATRCFVHWAGEASMWYQELRRVTRYTACLGRFVTVDEYFRDTYDPGIHDRFKADQYHSPWLLQQAASGNRHPISSSVNYWRHQLRLQSWLNCALLWLCVEDRPESREQVELAQARIREFNRDPHHPRWEHELSEVSQQLCVAAAGLTTSVIGSQAGTTQPDERGCTLVNPWSYPRRIGLADSPVMPALERPIYAAEQTDDGPRVVVDVPSMGLAHVRDQNGGGRQLSKRPPPLAEGNVLRNEFLEAHIDARSGALTSFRAYQDRSNRLSQQLAFRMAEAPPRGDESTTRYSTMVGESVEVVHADSIFGQIQSRGRLIDHAGKALADFVQTFSLWRGSRVVELLIDIQPHCPPGPDPWDSYYACRFAWSNEAMELIRGLNDARVVTSAKRIEAPQFIQFDDGASSTTILTGGLPFHRRVDRRLLDTLLITGHESQRQFRIGIGLDLKQPFREALAFMSPEVVVPLAAPAKSPSSLWLVHVDARHVLCTLHRPLFDEDRLVGICLRLIEVDGREGRVGVQVFRPLASARKIDGLGQTVELCDVDDRRLTVQVSPNELAEVEVRFATSPGRVTTSSTG